MLLILKVVQVVLLKSVYVKIKKLFLKNQKILYSNVLSSNKNTKFFKEKDF